MLVASVSVAPLWAAVKLWATLVLAIAGPALTLTVSVAQTAAVISVPPSKVTVSPLLMTWEPPPSPAIVNCVEAVVKEEIYFCAWASSKSPALVPTSSTIAVPLVAV